MRSTLRLFTGKLKPTAIAISMTKGLEINENGPQLMSEMISSEWNINHTAVVMGANLANDVALNNVVEATVASVDIEVAKNVSNIFNCSCFRTNVCTDVTTVELCGALKNVIALGSGFCDVLYPNCHSSKAVILRQGLLEISQFCKLVSKSSNSFNENTFFESCGFPDLVATSYGGRNRLCAEEFARRKMNLITKDRMKVEITVDNDDIIKMHNEIWKSIETEFLNGQYLAGLETCCQVIKYLNQIEKNDKSQLFPATQFKLFRKIYNIAFHGDDINTLFD